MTKPKNSNCDKNFFLQNLKIQIVTKLKKSNGQKKSKTLIVKLKKNDDKTRKIQIVITIKNSNCDKTQKLKLGQNQKK